MLFWHGMIDSPTKDKLWKVWDMCEKKMHMKAPFHDFTTPDECAVVGNVMDLAGDSVFPKSDLYAPNQYDVTTCKLYIYIYNYPPQ
jgi:hypothetical protein